MEDVPWASCATTGSALHEHPSQFFPYRRLVITTTIPMNTPAPLEKVAFLGNYLPRKCGLATFTSDVRNAVARRFPEIQCPAVAMNDRPEGYDYPSEVRFEIPEADLSAYRRAADFLNLANPDVLCVQHEFGIYGGKAGAHLLALLRAVRMPVVTTLHTILRDPSLEQRKVFEEVLQLSTRLVVMSHKGAGFLQDIYGVDAAKIDIIPHGIPDVPFVDPNFFKDQFGVEGKQVLLTFGLLSPNKGIENVLLALPEIVKEFPDVVYIVLGATHPNLVRDQGESYRIGLERLAKEKGVDDHVIFFNRFVDLEELTEFISASDIYVTPYLNEQQSTSGTLAYSFGAGNAVVSTPYWHAAELLADGRGILVPFSDPGAIANAVKELLGNESLRHSMRKNAYLLGRTMTWEHVAERYGESFAKARTDHTAADKRPFYPSTLSRKPRDLPPWRFDHLLRMSDSTGIFQHASHTIPDFIHGYCTDDNARALLLMVLLEELEEHVPSGQRLVGSYAAFLNYAFRREAGRFRNFMSFDRRWLEETGSEDSHGRALWALGTCVGRTKNRSLRTWAAGIFEDAVRVVEEFTSPRAWAFAILGLHEYLQKLEGDRHAERLRGVLSQRLVSLYQRNVHDGWRWFEGVASYDNAKLPHALILTGSQTNDEEMLEIGLTSLRWLIDHQTGCSGCFSPIGCNGFWVRGTPAADFDQQPIEAYATLNACLEAYQATGDEVWLKDAQRAFDWFLGDNDLGVPLYDPHSGGCRDGLHVDRPNENQGAESTLAFLLSLADMRKAQQASLTFETVRSVRS